MRAAVIQLDGIAAGRPSEIATLSPDVMHWDELLECVLAVWPQMKTHKAKLVLVMELSLPLPRSRLLCRKPSSTHSREVQSRRSSAETRTRSSLAAASM